MIEGLSHRTVRRALVRRFFKFLGLVATVIVVIVGVMLAIGYFDKESPKAQTPTPAPQSESDISRIDIVSLTAVGCEETSAVFELVFNSTGSGTVDVTVVRAEDNVIANSVRELPVTESTTKVRLVMSENVDGEAIIQIKAANYDVTPGEKGDETAFNQTKRPITYATCTYRLSNSMGYLLAAAYLVALLVASYLVWRFLLRPLTRWVGSKKKQKAKGDKSNEEEASPEGQSNTS